MFQDFLNKVVKKFNLIEIRILATTLFNLDMKLSHADLTTTIINKLLEDIDNLDSVTLSCVSKVSVEF